MAIKNASELEESTKTFEAEEEIKLESEDKIDIIMPKNL